MKKDKTHPGEMAESENVYYNPNFRLNYTLRRNNPQLAVCEYGWEKCYKGHYYGPTKRNYFIFHYVVMGGGTYEVAGRKYSVHSGQAFLLPPHLETFYCANPTTPWQYYWVGFNGVEVKNLLARTRFRNGSYVCDVKNGNEIEELMKKFLEYKNKKISTEYALLGLLYLLFSLLIQDDEQNEEQRPEDTDYISRAMLYIGEHYSENISIQALADQVGLERSYFCRLFKDQISVSPQRYLINLRMTKAQIMMQQGRASMAEIARSVGYPNYANFVKIFRKYVGLSPSEYAKRPFERG